MERFRAGFKRAVALRVQRAIGAAGPRTGQRQEIFLAFQHIEHFAPAFPQGVVVKGREAAKAAVFVPGEAAAALRDQRAKTRIGQDIGPGRGRGRAGKHIHAIAVRHKSAIAIEQPAREHGRHIAVRRGRHAARAGRDPQALPARAHLPG